MIALARNFPHRQNEPFLRDGNFSRLPFKFTLQKLYPLYMQHVWLLRFHVWNTSHFE